MVQIFGQSKLNTKTITISMDLTLANFNLVGENIHIHNAINAIVTFPVRSSTKRGHKSFSFSQ